MLLTAWLPALRGWCALVRSGAGGIARHEAGYGIKNGFSLSLNKNGSLECVKVWICTLGFAFFFDYATVLSERKVIM